MAELDSTAPVLTGLSFPDFSEADRNNGLVFAVSAADEGSGVDRVTAIFDSPNAGPLTLNFSGFADGRATLRQTPFLPDYVGSATWTLREATVTDKAGNSAVYDPAAVRALGGATGFTYADTTAPVLTQFGGPLRVDATAGPAQLVLSYRAEERGTAIDQVTIELDREIDLLLQTQGNRGTPPPTEFSGTVFSAYAGTERWAFSQGLFLKTGRGGSVGIIPNIDPATAPGTYNILSVTLRDMAGNVASYDAAQLRALGANTAFTVTTDMAAPRLTDLAVTSTGGSDGLAVTFRADVADVGAGVERVVIQTAGPGGIARDVTLLDYNYVPPGRDLHDFADGTSSITAAFPTGTTRITGVRVVDNAGNATDYDPAALRGFGVVTRFGEVAEPADFGGDGRADILWRNANGAVSVWAAAGEGYRQAVFDAQVAGEWRVADTFDWNGDGREDVLWQRTDGLLSVWTGRADGSMQQSALVTAGGDAGWRVFAAGDLDGDGRGDLVWRRDDGAIATWTGTDAGFRQGVDYHAAPQAGWAPVALGDFDGDGMADLLWRSAGGAVSVWRGDGGRLLEGSYTHAPVDARWRIAGVGDVDGDGRDDIVWTGSAGEVTAWLSTGAGFLEGRMNATVAPGWSVAKVGDANGDGSDDLFWRGTGGEVSVWHAADGGWRQTAFYDASVSRDWAIVG